MLAKIVAFSALGASLWMFLNTGILLTLSMVLGAYLATGGWRFMRIVLLTLPRDVYGLRVLITVTLRVKYNIRMNRTVPKIFDENVLKYPNKTFLMFNEKQWSFKDSQDFSNRVGNYFYESGYRKGDVVAVFSENCLEYIPLWLGLSRIGVTAALINFNLRDISLTHCIQAANAKGVIYADNLQDALKDIKPHLSPSLNYYAIDGSGSQVLQAKILSQEVTKRSSYTPPNLDVKCADRLLLVYTSGTTGLPKAAVVSHTRFCYLAYGVQLFFKITPADIDYISLPLYHTAGGILGAGQGVLGASTLAIRAKFSASQFWTDCVKYKATTAQYIGEICRYLLAQPVRPEETQHTVRLMFGNGVKPQIWKQFQERFGVKLIGEFYGATEGNCAIVNFENRIGAVGFGTRIAPFLYPITLMKVNPETNEIIRDKNGICVKAEPGEPGELVGKIVKGNPVREFDGYVDDKSTSKKVIHDVFVKGDLAFSTGDILVMDELGYMYFRDRTGDTFRWRGENVSTNEVEAVISNAIRLQDAVVYGVEVPGNEGRAGMAAIVDETNSVDVAQLGLSLNRSLPVYARPLFLRFLKEADTTGTFKLKKNKLRDEGFDVSVIKDRIHYLNPDNKQYELLTPAVHANIISGKLRL
uniref:Very long-chain fatty acid transport protein n=1 Tax=Arion vulgaris TaxID=1028688 RepID=A0A0B6Z9V5_9EUPU